MAKQNAEINKNNWNMNLQIWVYYSEGKNIIQMFDQIKMSNNAKFAVPTLIVVKKRQTFLKK